MTTWVPRPNPVGRRRIGLNFPAVIVPTRAQKKVRRPTASAPLAVVRGSKRSTTRHASHRDTDNRATGEMLASRAHSTGRQTKYRAAEAVAGRRRIPGNAQNLSGAGLCP